MAHDPRPARPRVAGLLVASLALAVVDVVLLGLAAAFGPGGFGGDRTMSRTEVLRAHLEQSAGLAGCLLCGAAMLWALTSAQPHRRRRGVRWLVAAQLLATALLVWL